MTAEANNPALDDELNTTAPQSTPADWKMPEPVFRRTSGKLPKGFEKPFVPTPTGEHEASSQPASSQPSEDAVEAYVEPKPKNPTLKILVVALALIAMAAFIVAFLTVVYFIFLRSSD